MHYERVIHACQEIVLFVAYLLQLFLVQRPDLLVISLIVLDQT